MYASRDRSQSTGMGLTGWLTLLFIALKLTGVIDWSWWWVLSPIWISATVVIGLLAVVLTGHVLSQLRK